MIHFAIYRHPIDYPDKYVVRRWYVEDGNVRPDLEPTAVVDSLAQARAMVPPEHVRLDRWPEDDPVIEEVWLYCGGVNMTARKVTPETLLVHTAAVRVRPHRSRGKGAMNSAPTPSAPVSSVARGHLRDMLRAAVSNYADNCDTEDMSNLELDALSVVLSTAVKTWLQSETVREVVAAAFAEWDGAEFGELTSQQQEIDVSAARVVLAALAEHVEKEREQSR